MSDQGDPDADPLAPAPPPPAPPAAPAVPPAPPALLAPPAPPAAPAAPAVGPTPFALTPGRSYHNAVLDYTSRPGQKAWEEATYPLPIIYDVNSRGAVKFCENMRVRAQKSGWDMPNANILTIPDSNGINRHLITNYGMLTVEDIHAQVMTYAHLPTRQAQNGVQMFHAIFNSLSEEGRDQIANEHRLYRITLASGEEYPAGPILFKVVMAKAIVDTRATVYHYRSNLMHLDTYMGTVKSDITAFNKYVTTNQLGLSARGQSVDDLLYYLFEGYKTASDKTFVKYITDKRDRWNDGSEDLTPELLMRLAENKYQDMIRDETWNQMSAEQQEIVAMSAKVTQIKDENLKLSRALSKIKTGKGNKDNKGDKKEEQDSKKGKKFKKKSFKQKQEESAKWKREKPKSNDPKKTVNGHSYHTRTVDNKTYYWCEYHEAWVLHLPEDDGENGCKLRKKLLSEEKGTKKVSFAAALTTVMNELESDEE